MIRHALFCCTTFLLFQIGAVARADSIAPAKANPRAYAILVGNNLAGAGQSDLLYAESDAKRFQSVLRQLGGYDLAKPHLLLSPSPMELWNHFAQVQDHMEADASLGQDSVLFFYYSGHARSSAIDLGPQQIPLQQLRDRIESMPAGLKVVILDACQSGAISRVKGATKTEDFSVNSVSSLRMKGMAIMASSSGSELSQESDSLQGSYFTHHLVAGLRGAADANGDGLVTLSEAYEYSYHQTLLATSVSAVGKQHVTLETDLRGKGDLTLTSLSRASATLQLPAEVGGEFTISRKGSKTVVAEVHKGKGLNSVLALAPGKYSVVVRESATSARRCELRLVRNTRTAVVWDECTKVSISSASDKGGGHRGAFRPEGLGLTVEYSMGLRGNSSSAYTDRLKVFGYARREEFLPTQGVVNVLVMGQWSENLYLGLSSGLLETEHLSRHTDGASTYNLDWDTYHLSAAARLLSAKPNWWMQFYVEGSLGIAWANSRLRESAQTRYLSENHYGVALVGNAGVMKSFGQGVGFTAKVGYSLNNALSNQLGETHVSHSIQSHLGLSLTF